MARPITRSLDAHLKSLLFSPFFSPKPSNFTHCRTLITCSRNLITSFPAYPFSLPKTSTIRPSIIVQENRIFDSKCSLVFVRCLSSVSPSYNVEWNEPLSCSEIGDGSHINETESNNVDCRPSIPVRAFFFSTSVDLKGLVDQNKPNFIPPTSRMTNYVVFKFGNLKTDANAFLGATLSGSECSYMVVFQYGSIVLFNVPDHEVDDYLKIVERHSSALLPEMRKDEYEVREKPNLSTWMEAGLDHIMLQYLNTDGIRTIGSVLGQSIALDYYVRQVDGMVAEFTDINRAMEKTGTFTMERKKLFQLVGKANSNLADVILKLGLFERAEELEIALMEMVKQDNRRILSARVEQLEQEVSELRQALSDKQEQEHVMLQVLMRVEQEQKVTEDARRFAEQEAEALRHAAQVLQEKNEETISSLAEMEKRAVMAESMLEATLQYQSGQIKAQASPRAVQNDSISRCSSEELASELPARKISLLSRPFGLGWGDKNKGMSASLESLSDVKIHADQVESPITPHKETNGLQVQEKP